MASRQKKRAPAETPEAQELRMVSYAMDLAERQLIEGTASPSVITHFLKIGSMRYGLEKEKLESDIQLQRVKADSIESQKQANEQFAEAIKAFGIYSKPFVSDEYEDGEDDVY